MRGPNKGKVSRNSCVTEAVYDTSGKWAQQIEEHVARYDGEQYDKKTVKVNDGQLFRTLRFNPDDPTTDDPDYTGTVDAGPNFAKDSGQLFYRLMGRPRRGYWILGKAIESNDATIEGCERIEEEECLKVVIGTRVNKFHITIFTPYLPLT